MYCSKCGFNLPEDGNFCPSCGNPVSAITTQPENTDNKNSVPANTPSVQKKKNLPLIIGSVVAGIILLLLIIVIFFLITGDSSATDNGNRTDEQTTDAEPVEIKFEWVKEPFLVADDMCYVTDYYADYIYNEYALFYNGRKCGVADNNGRIISDPVFSKAVFCEECNGIAFDNYSKILFFDTGVVTNHGGHGGYFSKIVYDIYSNTFLHVCGDEGPLGEVDFDTTGCYIVYECRKEYATTEGSWTYYNYIETGRIGLYNNGKLVVPFEYELTTGISEGIIGMYNGENWTYFDTEGNVVYKNVPTNGDVLEWNKIISPTSSAYTTELTDLVYEFSCGSVPMKQGDKWGYMDKNGDMVISARFEKALPFVDNRAWVRLDGKWGIIEIK